MFEESETHVQLPLTIEGSPIVNDNYELKKHSAVSQISNRISLIQRKSYNTLLYFAREQATEDPNREFFTLPVSTLRHFSGIYIKDNKHVVESLKELMSIIVDYNLLSKDKKEEWGAFPLLAEVRVQESVVSFALPPSIKSALLNPRIYARINIAITKGLTSKYSLALYEIARDYVNVSIPKMSIDVFKELMGVEKKQYDKFPDLRRRVIEPAVEEINKKTDIRLEVEYIRENRNYSHIQFTIKEQLTAADGVSVDDAMKVITDLIINIPELSLNEKFMDMVTQALREKGLEYVYSNLQYAILRAKKNVEAYATTAIEEDFAAGSRAKNKGRKEKEAALRVRKKQEGVILEQDNHRFSEEKVRYIEYFESLPKDEQEKIYEALMKKSYFGPREIQIMLYLKNDLGVNF